MSFPQGHALLIGVGTHRHHRRLDVPITVADAKAVAEVLQDSRYCGYPENQVQVLHDAGATKAGILSALNEIADKTNTDDTVFLFYCGHGALGTDGNYYLVSHDAKVQGGRVVAGTGISEGELLAKLKAIDAQRVLMVFNACHSGNISPTLDLETESFDTSNPDEASAMALLGTGQGRIIMVACREQQVSYIGKGTNTIFTKALIDGLRGVGVRNNNGFISAFSLYEHIYETVREIVQAEYKATQEPELTILKGVGPFAVSRYKGASTLGGFDESEPLPEGKAIREVSPSQSERMFVQRNIQTGGDFVGRDKVVQGDEVRGDKVQGDKYSVGNIQGPAAFGPGAQAKMAGGVNIGSVAGDIHGSNIAGRDINNVNVRKGTSTDDDPVTKNPALQSLRTLLSSLYDTEADARRLAQESNLDATKVDFSTNSDNRWHSLLVEAHHQGRVKAVVSNASFEYEAQADKLKQAYQAYVRSQE